MGHDLCSHTPTIQHYIVPGRVDESRRLILVDTPGFGDTHVDDTEILKQISVWLACS